MYRKTAMQPVNKRQKAETAKKQNIKGTKENRTKISDFLRFSLHKCISELEAEKLTMTDIRLK